MRKQKKFMTEEQILKAIDVKRELAEHLSQAVGQMDEQRKAAILRMTLCRSDDDKLQMQVQIEALKDNIKQSGKKHYNILNVHLPRLKRTLAAFRTEHMPFVDDGVVLQK